MSRLRTVYIWLHKGYASSSHTIFFCTEYDYSGAYLHLSHERHNSTSGKHISTVIKRFSRELRNWCMQACAFIQPTSMFYELNEDCRITNCIIPTSCSSCCIRIFLLYMYIVTQTSTENFGRSKNRFAQTLHVSYLIVVCALSYTSTCMYELSFSISLDI